MDPSSRSLAGQSGLEPVTPAHYPRDERNIPPQDKRYALDSAKEVIYPSNDNKAWSPPRDGEPRMCGLRRTTFLLVLSNIVLLLTLIIVAVAEGVVLSNRAAAAQNNSLPAQSCPAAASGLSSSLTGTSASPAATTASAASSDHGVCLPSHAAVSVSNYGVPTIECPLATAAAQYTVPGTDVAFKKMCDVDFSNNDMARVPATSMADCLALCAQLYLYPASSAGPCRGVTWVYGDGLQGVGLSFCYPKSNVSVGTPKPGVGLESAILLTDALAGAKI